MNNVSDIPLVKNPQFIKKIVEQGILNEKEALEALKSARDNALAVLVNLTGKHPAKKSTLCKLWGDSVDISYVDLDKTFFQKDVLQLVSRPFARDNFIIPIYKMGDIVTVAVSDPANPMLLKKIEMTVKSTVSPVFSPPNDIIDAIEVQYQNFEFLDDFIKNELITKVQSDEKVTAEKLEKIAGDKAVVSFTRGLLLLAVKEKASDIHLEPGENFTRIRFRIDGVLQERLKLDSSIVNTIVCRLKILANKDITEKRRPQDGRISLKLPNKSIDFRFSSVPTIYGEKIVLRILGGSQLHDVPGLSDLGLSKINLDKLKRILENPNGVFFVTGPTGSGKTTTLYAAISHINKSKINIMTIEDPVEYRLEGINQVQVNDKIGLDFANVLRSFLRQDPDVILVGEIRDAETATIASQAALTGHLVFATMHTNNALQAVTRLVEIGVEPFLVAPSIIGVLSQRLVRRLCDYCKEKYQLTSEEIEKYFIWNGETPVYFYRDKGCEKCNHTGFNGRIAIHELFIMNNEIRSLVANNASIIEIEKVAKNSGFRTMRHDGLKKVLRGFTTLSEVDRVIIVDEV